MFSDNDNVRCVGTRPVGSTMEFPLVTAAEDSSSGAFGGWRPGECGHGNWRMGSCFLIFVMSVIFFLVLVMAVICHTFSYKVFVMSVVSHISLSRTIVMSGMSPKYKTFVLSVLYLPPRMG